MVGLLYILGKVVVHMISTYVRRGRHILRRWALDPTVHALARGAAHVLAGFCLSAASLEQGILPLVLGLVWACRGWRAVLVAAGGVVGYGVFWGAGSLQGIFWTGLALLGVLVLGDKRISRELPLLIPAIGMLMVSAVGLGFQLLAGDTTPIPLYLIRVALGGAAPWLFTGWLRKREPILEWLCWGLFTLGLAQIAPVRWLGLGFVAAGFAAVWGTFPCAAAVGLALDMAGITPVPMTAVTVLSFFLRFLPRYPGWMRRLGPACVGLFLMYICGPLDLLVLPGLLIGGIAATFFTREPKPVLRRGETGAAQVKLEMAAGVLAQTRHLLTQVPERTVDADALVQRAVRDACAGCAARGRCRDDRRVAQLSGSLLAKPLLTIEEVPVRCKKGSRVLSQLRRAQEQLRTIQADRQRQQEYREAVVQQYDFLGQFLCGLSDDLCDRSPCAQRVYDPLVFVYGNRSGSTNADRCMEFPGVQNKYYVLLCDGMGTGPGAVQEGQTAGNLLRDMLCCGFPAEYALRSLNSICALRDRAGAVTVDLAELSLDTGKVTLYKWGAAASYLVGAGGTEKLGIPSAPPGLSVTGTRETCCGVLLRKGQLLLLVSDGLVEAEVLDICRTQKQRAPAALAEALLKNAPHEDDATVVTIQLVCPKS